MTPEMALRPREGRQTVPRGLERLAPAGTV